MHAMKIKMTRDSVKPFGIAISRCITAALLILLAWSLMPVTLHAQTNPRTVIYDNFEGTFPSGKWSAGVDETGGSGCRWERNYAAASSGSHSISPIDESCVPGGNLHYGPLPLNANIWLKYGPFDLTGDTSAEVSMRFNAQLSGQHRVWIGHNLSDNCFYEVDSPFQGSNFYNGSGAEWTDLSLDISSRVGAANVCVYVVLSTDDTAAGAEFAFFDDFAIYANGGPAPVDGSELQLHSIDVEWDEYYAGDEVPIRFSITNHGNAASGAWDVEFWAAGRVEFYPFVGDHRLGTAPGSPIAPGETRQIQAVVEASNSLPGPGTWSVRGFLNYQDANQQNNVAVHAFSLRNLGVRGQVVATENAEGVFPSAGWSVQAEPDSGCTWGKTAEAGNGSTSSLSPVATACINPVGTLTGPLPSGKTVMNYGPVDTSSAVDARLTFRYFARMSQRNDFSIWTKEADAQGCAGEHTFKSALRDFETGWTNHSFPLPISSNLCIQLEFLKYQNTVFEGDNWFLIDDFQFVANSHGLRVASNEDLSGTYHEGATIEFNPVIENFGDEDISDFSLTYGIRNLYHPTSYVTLGQSAGHSLNAGQSQLILKSFQLPESINPNDYKLWVRFDYNGNWNKEPAYLEGRIRLEGPPDILVSPLTIDMEITDSAVNQLPGNNGAADKMATAQNQGASTAKIFRQESVSELRNKLRGGGKASIIVELLDNNGSLAAVANTSTRQARQRTISDSGNELLQATSSRGLDIETLYQYRDIPFMAMSVDESALEYLVNSPLIGSIVEDHASEPTMESSNAVIRSAEAWASNYDGSGQLVAVLDTGVDISHSWFTGGASKVVAEACFSTADTGSQSLCPGGISPSIGTGSASLCNAPTKACSHGTHVAGTVAGNDGLGPGYGVARGAGLIAIQVFSYYTHRHLAKTSDQIAALEHVLDLSETMNIAAVNMSLGGGRYFDQESCDLANSATKAAIDNLREAGVATVISAGNDHYRTAMGAPGCISSAVSVGATNDDDLVADFSNIYPQIHLLAPGVDITSAQPGEQLGSFEGTSMAAPHVAGAFAVLKQFNPSASVDDTLALLQLTGDLVDDLRSDGVETNMRRINLAQALTGEADDSYVRFVISNMLDYSTLNITSIEFEPQTPWISTEPTPPFNLVDEYSKLLKIRVDKALVPQGLTQLRLLIHSDDPNENPYPGGVYLNIVRSGDTIFIDGFER